MTLALAACSEGTGEQAVSEPTALAVPTAPAPACDGEIVEFQMPSSAMAPTIAAQEIIEVCQAAVESVSQGDILLFIRPEGDFASQFAPKGLLRVAATEGQVV